mmetsp:Transcript_100072/g.280399  ORF Transcript_100072/g.280399 Transcript_100072/m.280399 type:complete len:203 (-) Transcript_100072:3625-4233(-)
MVRQRTCLKLCLSMCPLLPPSTKREKTVRTRSKCRTSMPKLLANLRMLTSTSFLLARSLQNAVFRDQAKKSSKSTKPRPMGSIIRHCHWKRWGGVGTPGPTWHNFLTTVSNSSGVSTPSLFLSIAANSSKLRFTSATGTRCLRAQAMQTSKWLPALSRREAASPAAGGTAGNRSTLDSGSRCRSPPELALILLGVREDAGVR